MIRPFANNIIAMLGDDEEGRTLILAQLTNFPGTFQQMTLRYFQERHNSIYLICFSGCLIRSHGSIYLIRISKSRKHAWTQNASIQIRLIDDSVMPLYRQSTLLRSPGAFLVWLVVLDRVFIDLTTSLETNCKQAQGTVLAHKAYVQVTCQSSVCSRFLGILLTGQNLLYRQILCMLQRYIWVQIDLRTRVKQVNQSIQQLDSTERGNDYPQSWHFMGR